MNSETPETDAIAPAGLLARSNAPHVCVELAGHARTLERERNAARAEANHFEGLLELSDSLVAALRIGIAKLRAKQRLEPVFTASRNKLISEQQEEIAALWMQLLDALGDAERLQFMAERGYWFGHSRDGELCWLMRLGDDDVTLSIQQVGDAYPHWRQAIDNAMKEPGNG